MPIIELYRNAVGPVKCRGLNTLTKGSCGAETFVTVNQTIDTSKKEAIFRLGCYECGARMGKPDPRFGLGQTYGEVKYPVKDHKQELIEYANARAAEWGSWLDENGIEPPKNVDVDSLNWDDDDEEDEKAEEPDLEPPKNINVDDLDWD